jgi:hypothetical protein
MEKKIIANKTNVIEYFAVFRYPIWQTKILLLPLWKRGVGGILEDAPL